MIDFNVQKCITFFRKFAVDYAEALQFKLKLRGPPPVYNAHRLLERPFPVLPRLLANRIASRRMSVPLPLSRALGGAALNTTLDTTQQNRKTLISYKISLFHNFFAIMFFSANQIPNRVLKRRTSAPPSLKRTLKRETPKKNAQPIAKQVRKGN